MIKPVYISDKDEDVLKFIDQLANFSEWVRQKIKFELGSAKQDEIEQLIRRIIKEEKGNDIVAPQQLVLSTKDTEQFIQQEEVKRKEENEEENSINGWYL